jgi:hypothetical protein
MNGTSIGDIVPIALLRAHLRRKELLAAAADRRDREGKKPRRTWIWSGWRKKTVRVEV